MSAASPARDGKPSGKRARSSPSAGAGSPTAVRPSSPVEGLPPLASLLGASLQGDSACCGSYSGDVLCYAVELAGVPGKFNVQAAVDLGVPNGPVRLLPL